MFKKLYAKGKNKEIRVWNVRTEGPDIITEHGQLDGKMQISRKTAKAKNIGKSNETSPEEQAVLQATSMYKKQIDKGYFLTIEEAQSKTVLLPMLANKFDDKKHKISYPCITQPKLDGLRSLIYWENGEIKLLSRGGKEYKIPHIAKACEGFLPKGRVFDGEVYLHGTPLQDINSLVKRNQENSIKLEYWIYDSFLIDKPWIIWKDRFEYLRDDLYPKLKEANTPLKHVPWAWVTYEDQVRSFESEFKYHGYEGSIIRDFRGTYEVGNRSSYLLKVKSFIDEEFPIVGFKDGEGKFKECVIWVCQTPEGKEFDVVPKGTLEQKAEWFKHGIEYVGKKLKVQFFAYTKDKKPQFPVGIAVRLEEDMDE